MPTLECPLIVTETLPSQKSCILSTSSQECKKLISLFGKKERGKKDLHLAIKTHWLWLCRTSSFRDMKLQGITFQINLDLIRNSYIGHTFMLSLTSNMFDQWVKVRFSFSNITSYLDFVWPKHNTMLWRAVKIAFTFHPEESKRRSNNQHQIKNNLIMNPNTFLKIRCMILAVQF